MKLNRYSLWQTNEALADVASGRVLKALIDPRLVEGKKESEATD